MLTQRIAGEAENQTRAKDESQGSQCLRPTDACDCAHSFPRCRGHYHGRAHGRLGYHEIDELLSYIQYLKENGKSIIYISHRLEEIFKIADEVTVLRDGCLIGTKPVSEMNEKRLIHMMVNRDVEFTDEFVQGHQRGEEILRVENLSRSELVKDVSFNLYRGEVLGFFGLVGSGAYGDHSLYGRR